MSEKENNLMFDRVVVFLFFAWCLGNIINSLV